MHDRAELRAGVGVDHVLYCGSDLEELERVFSAVGLTPEYGGRHAHGRTHNSLVGFDDGSYLELISTVEPGMEEPERGDLIRAEAGPCGWAVEPTDIRAERERLVAAGMPVEEVRSRERETPAGAVAAWEFASVGTDRRGATLPFLITDTAPREHRISPSPSVAGTELTGISTVVLGVPDLDDAETLFRGAYDLPAATRFTDQAYPGRLAVFEDTPLVLVTPGEEGTWLAERVEAFGPLPCAYLIHSTDPAQTKERHPLTDPVAWADRTIHWYDHDALRRTLGITTPA